MPTIDDLLLPTFVSQHGLVSIDDVVRAGGADHHVTTRLATGRWERVDSGVYRLCGLPVTWRSKVLAPILNTRAPAAASHTTAATLIGIPGFSEGTPEISVARGAKLRRSSARIHTSTDLNRCRITTVDAIPTTEVSRTILDLARRSGDQRLLRSIEWARREKMTDWQALITTLAHHARRGRPGIRRLRRVIVQHAHRDEVTDSDFELLVLSLFREHGLPDPVLHHKVLSDRRFVAEVDLAYPDLRIAIELDGSVHLEPAVRERDLPRQNDLVLCGWTVLRFSWARFQRSPNALVAEVRAARAAALRALAG